MIGFIEQKNATILLRVACIVLGVLLLGSGILLTSTVVADEPPLPPDAYYGNVTVDGEPAPAGIEIVAEIDGEKRGSIVTDEPGKYGDASGIGEKLVVEGSDEDVGKPITFLVAGETATTDPAVVEWESGGISEVSLAIDELARSTFEVEINEEASTTTVESDETVTVVVDVENVGDAPEEKSVTFLANDEVVETTDVELEGGETDSLEFTTAFATEGTYTVAVETPDDADQTVVTVVDSDGSDDSDDSDGSKSPSPPPAATPADISITDLELSAEMIEEGDAVDATATFENTGEKRGSITATLVVDGDVHADQSVTVDGESTDTVTFTRTFDQAGTYALAVGVPDGSDIERTVTVSETVSKPANMTVVDAELSAGTIEAGGAIEMTLDIESEDERVGTETIIVPIELATDDEKTAIEYDVEVDDDSTARVTITEFDESGEYDVSVDGIAAGTVTVIDPEPTPADVSVLDAEVSETTLESGESITVTATLENDGEKAGDVTVEVVADATVIGEQSVAVDGESTETVTVTESLEEPGEYEIRVHIAESETTAEAGLLTVVADDDGGDDGTGDEDVGDDTEDGETDTADDDSLPGFGLTVTVMAILSAAMLFARRRCRALSW